MIVGPSGILLMAVYDHHWQRNHQDLCRHKECLLLNDPWNSKKFTILLMNNLEDPLPVKQIQDQPRQSLLFKVSFVI